MKNISSTISMLTLLPVMVISLFVVPIAVDAQFKQLTDVQRQGTADGDVQGAISDIIGFIATLLAVIAILMIVTAGVMYMTSGGDTSQIDRAKSWLTWGIIGLVIALFAYVIVEALSSVLGAGA